MLKPTTIGLLAAVVAAVCLTGPAAGEDYPQRPVRLIVGFPSGAAGDVVARIVGNRLGQLLGQKIVIENRPGASSNIAAAYAAHAAKDGYTLFLGTIANAINVTLYPKLNFNFAKDFQPIGLMAVMPVLLVVNPSLGVKTGPELIALAKSKPGQLFYGSTGVGTTPHLAGELFNKRTGLDLVHVPYPGSPQAVTDLLAGRIQVMFASASTAMPYVRSGKLVAIAVAGTKRADIDPALPTMAEAGLPDFDASLWFGLEAPTGTPQPIIDKLARTLDKALQSEDVLKNFKAQGYDRLSSTPGQFAAYINREIKDWGDAVRAAGVKR